MKNHIIHIEKPVKQICKYSTHDILEGLKTLFGYNVVNARHISKRAYIVNLPKQFMFQLYFWLKYNKSEEYTTEQVKSKPSNPNRLLNNLLKTI